MLSEIRLNHARTNIIITVGIAISPAPVRKKPTPGRYNNLRCFYIDQCEPLCFQIFDCVFTQNQQQKTCHHNDPKYSERLLSANSVDPDQTAPDLGLYCLRFYLHLLDTLLYSKTTVKCFGQLQQCFQVSKCFGLLHHLSHLMILWYFSSSVNSFFKRTCEAIQWG